MEVKLIKLREAYDLHLKDFYSYARVKDLARLGKFPSTRIGNRYFVSESDIIEFLKRITTIKK